MKTGYDGIDEAYRDMMPLMISYASRHLFNSDFAIDAAHAAFVKVEEYHTKHPKSKVASFILLKELKRAIRRINKANQSEIGYGLLEEPLADGPDNYDEEAI